MKRLRLFAQLWYRSFRDANLPQLVTRIGPLFLAVAFGVFWDSPSPIQIVWSSGTIILISWGELVASVIVFLVIVCSAGFSWSESKKALSRPRLRLTEFKIKDNYLYLSHARIGQMQSGQYLGPFIYVNFTNEPVEHGPEAIAKEVGAHIKFFSGRKFLFQVDARWAQADSPSKYTLADSTVALDKIDIGIGDTRQLDIVFKHPGEKYCYPWTNRNFHFQSVGFRIDEWKIEPGDVTAEIYLSGVGVRDKWVITFQNMNPPATFKVLQYRSVRWK